MSPEPDPGQEITAEPLSATDADPEQTLPEEGTALCLSGGG